MQNNKGDSGSPCQTPLELEKKPIAFSLTDIDNLADIRI